MITRHFVMVMLMLLMIALAALCSIANGQSIQSVTHNWVGSLTGVDITVTLAAPAATTQRIALYMYAYEWSERQNWTLHSAPFATTNPSGYTPHHTFPYTEFSVNIPQGVDTATVSFTVVQSNSGSLTYFMLVITDTPITGDERDSAPLLVATWDNQQQYPATLPPSALDIVETSNPVQFSRAGGQPFLHVEQYLRLVFVSPPGGVEKTVGATLLLNATQEWPLFHQDISHCTTAYFNPTNTTHPLQIVTNPATQRTTGYTSPEFELMHQHHHDAMAYKVVCFLGLRPFASQTDMIFATYSAPGVPTLMYTWSSSLSWAPPVRPELDYTPTGATICGQMRPRLEFFYALTPIVVYRGDSLFFGADPTTPGDDLLALWRWPLWDRKQTSLKISDPTVQSHFTVHVDLNGIVAAYTGVDPYVIPVGTSFTTTWGTHRNTMSVIPQRSCGQNGATSRWCDLAPALLSPAPGGITTAAPLNPDDLKSAKGFFDCPTEEYNRVITWSIHKPYGDILYYQLDVVILTEANALRNSVLHTPAIGDGMQVGLRTSKITALTVGNGHGVHQDNLSFLLPQLSPPFPIDPANTQQCNVSLVWNRTTPLDDNGDFLGAAEIRVIFNTPHDLFTNNTYNDTHIQRRQTCFFAPHPSVPEWAFDRILFSYVSVPEHPDWNPTPQGSKIQDEFFLPQAPLPWPYKNRIRTRTEFTVTVRDAQTNALVGAFITPGQHLTFTFAQPWDQAGWYPPSGCIYPGDALILTPLPFCFENFTFVPSPWNTPDLRIDHSTDVMRAALFTGFTPGFANCRWDAGKDIVTATYRVDVMTNPTTTTCRMLAESGTILIAPENETLWELQPEQSRTLNFTLVNPQTAFHWRCRRPDVPRLHDTLAGWVECDSQEYLESVRNTTHPCSPFDKNQGQRHQCLCSHIPVPECVAIENGVFLGPATTCSPLTPPRFPQLNLASPDIAQCEACKYKSGPTAYYWGPSCDRWPNMSVFRYEIIPNTQNSTVVGYNDVILFTIKYSGSPSNLITLYAESRSLVPFEIITLTSIAIPPTTFPDHEGVYTIHFEYPLLKKLQVDHALEGLTFEAQAGAGDGGHSPLTKDLDDRPILSTLARCQDPTDPSNPMGLCQNGGQCLVQTGRCQCNPQSLYQSGDLCEKNICAALPCVDAHTAKDGGERCVLVKAGSGDEYTPQCRCADDTRFGGVYCEIEKDCSARSTMSTCSSPFGTPRWNTTMNDCDCNCSGSRYTAPTAAGYCEDCNLVCLNEGKDYSDCLGSTCTCSSSTPPLFYGARCECRGVTIRGIFPLDPNRYAILQTKRQEVTALVASSAAAQSSNDMLTFLKPDPFTLFLKSFFQQIVVDYRTELQRQGVDTRELFVKDENGVEQINAESLTKALYIKDFQTTQSNTTDGKLAYYLELKLLAVDFPQCYDSQSVVDDTHWATTVSTVSDERSYASSLIEYLVQDAHTRTSYVDWKTAFEFGPLLSIDDPSCAGKRCQNNTGIISICSNALHFIIMIVAIFMMV